MWICEVVLITQTTDEKYWEEYVEFVYIRLIHKPAPLKQLFSYF